MALWKTGTGRRAVLFVLLSLLLSGAFAAAQGAHAQQNGGTQAAKVKQSYAGGKRRKGKGDGSQSGKQSSEAKKAEEEDSGIWDTFFPWADDGGFDDNWLSGLGLALLGILGALVTIYLFLGEFLPSMGGKAEYETLRLEIDELNKRRNKQLGPREDFVRARSNLSAEEREEATKVTGDLSKIIEDKENAARKTRRSLVAVGFPLYVILGGAFAVLLASNAPQALLIGFGWTAIVDRFGLKRELDEKSKKRDEASAKLVDTAKEAEEAKAKLAAVQKQLGEAQRTANTAVAAVAEAKRGGST